MFQQVQQWRSGHGEQAWLSMLVGTMTELSKAEIRSAPCDEALLTSVKAHLAAHDLPRDFHGSNFSLRN